MRSGDGCVGKRALVLAGSCVSKWQRLDQLARKEPHLFLLRYPGDPAEVLEYCRRLIPCVLVADEALVLGVDPEEFRKFVQFSSGLHVLVDVLSQDVGRVEQLVRLGCAGVLNSHTSAATVRSAVMAVVDGEYWMEPKLLAQVLRRLLQADASGLTQREREILHLIGTGRKNHEIAHILFISPQTVRWHLRSLYSKLGVHDRLQAESYARNAMR